MANDIYSDIHIIDEKTLSDGEKVLINDLNKEGVPQNASQVYFEKAKIITSLRLSKEIAALNKSSTDAAKKMQQLTLALVGVGILQLIFFFFR